MRVVVCIFFVFCACEHFSLLIVFLGLFFADYDLIDRKRRKVGFRNLVAGSGQGRHTV